MLSYPMRIYGDHGTVWVDENSGHVIGYEPEGSEEYANIVRFDLAEWRAHYGQEKCSGGDILDFGYWLLDRTYEAPEADWRASWRQSGKDGK